MLIEGFKHRLADQVARIEVETPDLTYQEAVALGVEALLLQKRLDMVMDRIQIGRRVDKNVLEKMKNWETYILGTPFYRSAIKRVKAQRANS